MKVYIKNQQRRIKVNQKRIISHIGKALHLLGLHKAEVSILLVNDRKMKELNLRYRGLDKTTDVLSFSQMENVTQQSAISKQQSILGDIVINLHKAKRQAVEHDLTFNEELSWLLIHGFLHLIGYEHEETRYLKNKMARKEKELFDVINLP
jgi:probable rRNA maturation factor